MFNTYSLLILGLTSLWIGAGLIVSSTEKLSHRLKLSSFLVSFFLLGFATSVPEIAVGITAVIQPGGSIRDAEVVKAADEHGMAMILTGMRHFRH